MDYKMSYQSVVRFSVGCMCDLALEDKNYNFDSDLEHYYNSTIKAENRIDVVEFFNIVKEITKEKGIESNIRLINLSN